MVLVTRVLWSCKWCCPWLGHCEVYSGSWHESWAAANSHTSKTKLEEARLSLIYYGRPMELLLLLLSAFIKRTFADATNALGWTTIFLPCGFFFFFLLFFPRLISAVADWMSAILPHMVWPNFGPLTAEIGWPVWGTPAHFNWFRILAALLHGI